MSKIKPTYITFEQAKLFKEKGFDEETDTYFLEKDNIQFSNISWGITQRKRLINSDFKEHNINSCSRPEQWQVLEWLLLNHRLDIIVKYPESKTNRVEGINSVYYDLEIYKLDGGDAWKLYRFKQCSDKKQEVYSAAFDYILKELI